MILFTKSGCKNCVIIKEAFDLEALNIKLEELTIDDSEAVSIAEVAMPVLVLDDSTVIAGRIEVEKALSKLEWKRDKATKIGKELFDIEQVLEPSAYRHEEFIPPIPSIMMPCKTYKVEGYDDES